MTMTELADPAVPCVPVLSASGLEVRSARGAIVEGISLQVRPRETLAIVGESGSGKSMTAKALSGLLPGGVTATGELTIGGKRISLSGRDPGWKGVRGGQVALIPQDPFTSLSPRHRCGEQILMPLARLPKADRAAAVAAALDEVGLPTRVAGQYPFQLSGGMRQRVAIAAALISRPQVVIADESTTALDVTTQREILDLLGRVQDERGTALILITHDLGVAGGRADRVVVLYAGRVAEDGPCGEVLRDPAHPYTGRLLACDPRPTCGCRACRASPGRYRNSPRWGTPAPSRPAASWPPTSAAPALRPCPLRTVAAASPASAAPSSASPGRRRRLRASPSRPCPG